MIRAQRKGRGSIFKSHSHHRKGAAKLRSVVRNPKGLRSAALCAPAGAPGGRSSGLLRGLRSQPPAAVRGGS